MGRRAIQLHSRDTAIVESDPHRLLEGILIASYAMGANKSYVHIRAEYRLPLERLRRALREMEDRGLVGENIMGTDFSHEIEIEATGHAYICGEETALMESVEGHRGAPRPRPPFPAAYGIFGRPTTINNVKTISYVPTVLEMGAEAFAAIGTENASGTAMLSLSGHVNKPGIAEIPVGINLAGVIENVAGGIRGGKAAKALQCGGPLGGIMSADEMDMPAEFQAMTAKGSPLGSGGILALDEDTCIVDLVKNIAEFIDAESCGKCFPCRKGATHISHVLSTITEGYGQEGDIAKLQNVGTSMVAGSLCGLGQLAPGVLTQRHPLTSVMNSMSTSTTNSAAPAHAPLWQPQSRNNQLRNPAVRHPPAPIRHSRLESRRSYADQRRSYADQRHPPSFPRKRESSSSDSSTQ